MNDILQDMGFAQDPIWPEVRSTQSSSDIHTVDCLIDVDGDTRTAMGGRCCYIAEIMVSHLSPKYQQEQDGLLTRTITETQTGTDRNALAKWVSERLNIEVERMKATYRVNQAIAKEEAAS